MRPWVLTQIPPEDVQIFRRITLAFMDLPNDLDTADPPKLSCHMLARAASRVFDIPYVDGYFHPICPAGYLCQHSWLKTPGNNIIDVYPVGVYPGPLLVHASISFSPGNHLYWEEVLSIDTTSVFFRDFVDRLEELLRRGAKTYKP